MPTQRFILPRLLPPDCSCWYAFIKELDRMQGRGSQVRDRPSSYAAF